MDKQLEQLEKEYTSVQIPEQLDDIVRTSISKHRRKKHNGRKWGLGSVAAAVLFTTCLNVSPVMAKSLSDIPVIGNVVSVLTWKTYTVDKDKYSANITVPEIENIGSDQITATLNEKYKQEAEALYEQFKNDMKDMEAIEGGGHLGVDSGYEIITDTDQLLTISRYTVETVGSSSTVIQYDTIDKQNELLLTLPSLFKNDQYVQIITDNVKEQMRQQMKETNNDKYYWVAGAGIPDDELFGEFITIDAEQGFYITEEGKLVVAFDKYDVAPGYMGNPTFEIPSEILQDVLVSDQYIH
ncbi:anti-sigma-V factor rsiV [Paenibacillus endoradicis]|uniref:anti-sigma-V factor rsiV n=1 Tax=Paenibacillus endoradicis TaxID=2972487 RepID=UPI002159382A|nr:anti-sigma-V factor rsiV [Paenibacillus endoradicis]MCR8658769.1 anti-sigma-V factor rsiV [Paenibacillus endoradicis]